METRDVTRTYKKSDWNALRKSVYERQGGKDYFTGMPLQKSKWQLHHLDQYNLNDLDARKYVGLNQKSHFIAHYFCEWARYEDFGNRIAEVVNRMREYKEIDKEKGQV